MKPSRSLDGHGSQSQSPRGDRSRSRSPQQGRSRSRSRSRSPRRDRYGRSVCPDYMSPLLENEGVLIEAAVSDILKWENGLSRIVASMALPHFTPDPVCGKGCDCDINDGYHIDRCEDGAPQWGVDGYCLGCGWHILHHN